MIKLRSATCLFRFCRADARSNHRKHTSPLTDPVGRCHVCRRAGVVVEVRFQQQIRGSWSTVALSSPAVCSPRVRGGRLQKEPLCHMLQHGFGFGGICVSYLHVHKHTHTLTAPTHPPTHLSESGDARCAADVSAASAVSAGVSCWRQCLPLPCRRPWLIALC